VRVPSEDDSTARLVRSGLSLPAGTAPLARSGRRRSRAPLIGALLYSACATATGSSGSAPIPSFSDWPPGARPEVVGKRVAENFLARPLDFETGGTRTISNAEAMTWYGALRVARLTRDADLQRRLIARFEPLKRPRHPNVSLAHHLDASIFGAVPLEIFMQTGDSAYLRLGLGFADRQWANPTAEGHTSQARWWIDDMYMISLIQLQAYRATRDTTYLNRDARLMAAYLDSLQRPNGLFHHGRAPFFWGRANGWIAAALTEVLSDLPPTHPQYRRIMAGYQRMMPAALAYQSPTGLWRQLLDKPELWLETSSTGMLTFAMASGVRNGWLDANLYGPAVRRAWLALVNEIDDEGSIANVSVGTNPAPRDSSPDAQYRYYVARARRTGEYHGQGPLTWIAMTLLR
jgi:unsaturated rhamnogalacturonyl hydrolase